jgi:flagellar biosynthetic protein FlhB
MAETEDRDQRTEEATPRRREDARSKGQVALSSELVAALGLAGGVTLLATGGAALARATADGLARGLSALPALGTSELDARTSAALIRGSLDGVLGVLAAVALPTVLVAGLAGYAQVGFRFTPQAVEADPSKLDPLRGLQRVFSARSVVRAAFAALKIVLIASSAAVVAWLHVDDVARAGTNEVGPLLAALGTVALRATAAALLVIVVLALVDMLFQRFQLERDLRMSKREVKEEHRLTEGDPHVRARIRRLQRELAGRRQMADVPKATVVVTNPTHYSVALRYEREGARGRGAPRVVAKGVDRVALRIREIAAEAGVMCFEDVALARALHARCEIGDEIPLELYQAVAEVLAYVYRIRGAGALAPLREGTRP